MPSVCQARSWGRSSGGAGVARGGGGGGFGGGEGGGGGGHVVLVAADEGAEGLRWNRGGARLGGGGVFGALIAGLGAGIEDDVDFVADEGGEGEGAEVGEAGSLGLEAVAAGGKGEPEAGQAGVVGGGDTIEGQALGPAADIGVGDAGEGREAVGGGLFLGGRLRRQGEETTAIAQAASVEDGTDAADEALGAKVGNEAEEVGLGGTEGVGEGGKGALNQGPGALEGVEPVCFLGGQSHGTVGSVRSLRSLRNGSLESSTSAGRGSWPRARRSRRVAWRSRRVAASSSGSS